MIPRIVVFDLDGTLAESKQPLDAHMGDLLAQLLQKIPVAVMSGAGFPQFQEQFASRLPPNANLKNLYLFPTNAAQCYLYANGAWRARYEQKFSTEERKKILLALATALHETGFDTLPQEIWGEQIEDRIAEISFSYYGQHAPLEVKNAWDPDQKKRMSIRTALLPLLPDFSVRIGGTTTIDITRKGITKAYGVTKLASMTGISPEDMLYVGDALFPGGNDEVVKESGIHTQGVKNTAETAEVISELLPKLRESTLEYGAHKSMRRIDFWLVMIVGLVLIAIVVAIGLAMYASSSAQTSTTPSATNETPSQNGVRTSTTQNSNITVSAPLPNSIITSPFEVAGTARGSWYSEAQFPITLQDANGNTLIQTPAHAEGDWMASNFVPFTADITFSAPQTATGTLILRNDNPSGDPARQQQITIPVRFR